jgi:hypothetical protein
MMDMEIERDAQTERVIELMRELNDKARQELADYVIAESGLTFVPALPVIEAIANKSLCKG